MSEVNAFMMSEIDILITSVMDVMMINVGCGCVDDVSFDMSVNAF